MFWMTMPPLGLTTIFSCSAGMRGILADLATVLLTFSANCTLERWERLPVCAARCELAGVDAVVEEGGLRSLGRLRRVVTVHPAQGPDVDSSHEVPRTRTTVRPAPQLTNSRLTSDDSSMSLGAFGEDDESPSAIVEPGMAAEVVARPHGLDRVSWRPTASKF